MPFTRDPNNMNSLIEWTDEINRIDRQFQIFDDRLFDLKGSTQTAVLFDVNETETVLLPAVSRQPKGSTYGKENLVRTYSLPLAYFKHSEYITQEDLQGVRRHGTPDGVETLDLVRAEKLEKLRRQFDQTAEYMKLQAVKGITKSPDGTVFADMFTEFGVTQDSIDFVLGTSTTDVAAKIREVRRLLKTNLQNGGFVNGIEIFVDPLFFDKLISHDTVKEAYKYYSATNQRGSVQPLRDDLNDRFTYGGVTFISLDGSFKTGPSTTEQLIADDTGHVVPNTPGLFRGWFGPSNKMELANRSGSDMFAWEYRDPKGEFHEIQMESAPLFICTRPKALIEVTTSN